MAKQVILGALEEVIGEYVLNIDKENLKIAALKGKIKLENVQLDGDLLGSYILGSMGLSGFGILSCWAETVKIYVPLKNLEKEPTRIEMRGCHLVCLPLLPSTANKPYGAGTISDPRCTLRTHAKRAKLARFEKNYMSGRIPGEGPVAKRILRAAKALESDLKKKNRRKGSSRKGDEEDEDDTPFFLSLVDDLDVEEAAGSSRNQEGTSSLGADETNPKDLSGDVNSTTAKELPDLPRDWKVKFREKIMRNLQASMHDIHVRCEVSECGLDFGHLDQLTPKVAFLRKLYDQRAFAFGVTLDNFIVRTANEKWQVGSHELGTKVPSTGHLGPNPYDSRNNKLVSWQNFCMYWDDDPPFLISDTPFIQTSDIKLSSEKFHSKLAGAMKALYNRQEPGMKVRESLQLKGARSTSDTDALQEDRPHEYCWQNFNYQVRTKTSNRTEPGPVSCLAEFLPFVWDIKFRPHQYVQYHKLKSAMLSQRRFDTMVKQRPSQSPMENPRAWWKYAMRCITSRPNARPWEDVKRISRRRHRYIELVLQKLSNSTGSSGYHGGLTRDESAELVTMEDLLPIEALFSFHLAALRIHVKSPLAGHWIKLEKTPQSPSRARSLTKPISRIFGGRSKMSRSRSRDPSSKDCTISASTITSESLNDPMLLATRKSASTSILDAMTARLGTKVWMTDFKFLHGSVNVVLLSASNHEIAMLNCEAVGTVKLMGRGNRNFFFDVTKFEVNDCQHDNTSDGKILVVQSGCEVETDRQQHDLSSDLSLSMSLPSQPTGSDTLTSFMDLPSSGVVCRLAASRANGNSTKLSFSAHPATLIWTRPCFDAVAEFFGAPSSALQTELSRHLRNVATPLARRAQLAFLSQSELMLHINVSAPKVWVPLSQSRNEEAGAIFFDAGNYRMSCFKDEQQPHSNWTINASDIQVNFAKWGLREVKRSIVNPKILLQGDMTAGLSAIIRPFHVRANSTVRDIAESSGTATGASSTDVGAVNCVDVLVSPICLNLVDAEILARSIGRWYSQGLLRVRGRVTARYDATNDLMDPDHQDATGRDQIRANATPFNLSVSIEKVEMALEGHSKVNFPDEHSIGSVDFTLFGGYAPTRTYVVEIFNINVRRLQRANTTTTKLLVEDVSVVQLQDQFEYVPMKTRHQANDSQYAILHRGTHRSLSQADREVIDDVDRLPGVLRASLFHDGVIHLDEVEADIEAVVLRVTPTTLKDCAKGIRRIVELVQLMTREMERKVHEEGRKARRRHRDEGTEQLLDAYDFEEASSRLNIFRLVHRRVAVTISIEPDGSCAFSKIRVV
jgi:Vacuolar sorting-associated protein 13, N-terminal/N-terminal region of Chorein or VPS13/Repeating coiled region of VPS13